MSELLSSITGGEGSTGFRLAPDLTYPSSKDPTTNNIRIAGINASAALTTALSLTGKFALSYLLLSGQSTETTRYVLTVDGVVIWDASRPATTGSIPFLGGSLGGAVSDIPIVCNTSMLLQVKTTADTNIAVEYLARPIL